MLADLPSRADCHSHTLHSDGTLSAIALLDLAKEKNLSGLSITDHDTLDAYATALPYAQAIGLTLLPGIEISASLNKTNIHVLGYAFHPQNPALQDFCGELQKKRRQRNAEICDKLKRCKIEIYLEELSDRFPGSIIGRPHIAALMVEKGLVSSSEKAFKRYLGSKGRAYVADSQTTVEEAISLIQQAGGLAVLAHPHFIKEKNIINALLAMPFDGIEAYYGRLGPKQEAPWIREAEKRNWLVTGGSDFHGGKKTYQSLGCSFTPEATFSFLQKRYQENCRAV